MGETALSNKAELRADPPDIMIQPNLGHIKFLEFNRAKEAIAEGYKEGGNQIRKFLGECAG